MNRVTEVETLKDILAEQERKHREIGPHWWVYEIFSDLTKEECDKMVQEWEAQIKKEMNLK